MACILTDYLTEIRCLRDVAVQSKMSCLLITIYTFFYRLEKQTDSHRERFKSCGHIKKVVCGQFSVVPLLPINLFPSISNKIYSPWKCLWWWSPNYHAVAIFPFARTPSLLLFSLIFQRFSLIYSSSLLCEPASFFSRLSSSSAYHCHKLTAVVNCALPALPKSDHLPQSKSKINSQCAKFNTYDLS